MTKIDVPVLMFSSSLAPALWLLNLGGWRFKFTFGGGGGTEGAGIVSRLTLLSDVLVGVKIDACKNLTEFGFCQVVLMKI